MNSKHKLSFWIEPFHSFIQKCFTASAYIFFKKNMAEDQEGRLSVYALNVYHVMGNKPLKEEGYYSIILSLKTTKHMLKEISSCSYPVPVEISGIISHF